MTRSRPGRMLRGTSTPRRVTPPAVRPMTFSAAAAAAAAPVPAAARLRMRAAASS